MEALFRKYIRDGIRDLLAPMGFRARGTAYRRIGAEVVHLVQTQRSRYSEKPAIDFAINLGAAPRILLRRQHVEPEKLIESQCHWRSRLCAPGLGDSWWTIRDETSARSAAEEVLGLLREHGLPALERLSAESAFASRWEDATGLELLYAAQLFRDTGAREAEARAVARIKESCRTTRWVGFLTFLDEIGQPLPRPDERVEDILAELEAKDRAESRITEAIRELEALLGADPTSPEDAYALGYALYLTRDASKQERARLLLRRVVAAEPLHFRALLYLGYGDYRRGHYEDALVYFRTAQSIALDDRLGLRSHEMVIATLWALGQVEDALAELARFAALPRPRLHHHLDPTDLATELERHAPLRGLHGAMATALRESCARLDVKGGWEPWFVPLAERIIEASARERSS